MDLKECPLNFTLKFSTLISTERLPSSHFFAVAETLNSDNSGGFRGDAGGAAAPPLASFRKIHGLPISKTVRTADSTIIIITNFYLAASSREIFLTVGGREGMKGLGALQRHQLPHPLAKILDPPLSDKSDSNQQRSATLQCFVQTLTTTRSCAGVRSAAGVTTPPQKLPDAPRNCASCRSGTGFYRISKIIS